VGGDPLEYGLVLVDQADPFPMIGNPDESIVGPVKRQIYLSITAKGK
jgi:hypothetical protein